MLNESSINGNKELVITTECCRLCTQDRYKKIVMLHVQMCDKVGVARNQKHRNTLDISAKE